MRKPVITNDLALAAALAAVGIPLFKHDDNSPPYVKLVTAKGNSFTFFFEEENADGEKTQDYIRAWYEDDYIDKNQDNPFSYIKAAFKNRETLLDVINKSSSLVVMEKGNKFALISSDAPEDIKQKVFSRL